MVKGDFVELDRLKLESKLSKKSYKVMIRGCRKRLHLAYKRLNPGKFKVLTWMFIFCVLFNIGALVLTNMLVVHDKPSVKVVESNPVQAKINDYETSPSAQWRFITIVLKQFLIWTGLVIMFLWGRSMVVDDGSYWVMLCFMVYYLVTMSMDFWNNFGWYLGKTIYGG